MKRMCRFSSPRYPAMVTFKMVKLSTMFVQAALYGVYLVTLAHCLRWLFYEDQGWMCRRLENVRRRTLIVVLLFFMLSTASLAIAFWMTLAVFAPEDNGYHSFIRLFNRLDIVRDELENAPILMTDAVLIYRCWLVYGRRWRVIILPLLLWSASLISTAFVAYDYNLYKDSKTAVEYRVVTQSHPVWTVFYLCSITTNVYATAAIIYRTLSIAKGNKNSSGDLYTTCRIFAKFGTLYTLASMLCLLGRLLDSSSNMDLFESEGQSINYFMPGITFNLILVCVSKARARRKRISDPRWLKIF
jgi:hypothetical protein